jgi:hypothetical protein
MHGATIKIDVLASLIHVGSILASMFQLISKVKIYYEADKAGSSLNLSAVSNHTNPHYEFYYVHGVCVK